MEFDLNMYLNEKYTPQQLLEIHHYETIDWRDYENQQIIPPGKIVDENFTVEYLVGTQIRKVSPIKSVSYFEWEVSKNDEKRNINVVDQNVLSFIISDFEKIMKYDRSSQYINQTLKKTENIRLTG